jgi:hypothetical protein
LDPTCGRAAETLRIVCAGKRQPNPAVGPSKVGDWRLCEGRSAMHIDFAGALGRVDRWQQRSPMLAIPVAVIKKFIDDGVDRLGVEVPYWGEEQRVRAERLATTASGAGCSSPTCSSAR